MAHVPDGFSACPYLWRLSVDQTRQILLSEYEYFAALEAEPDRAFSESGTTRTRQSPRMRTAHGTKDGPWLCCFAAASHQPAWRPEGAYDGSGDCFLLNRMQSAEPTIADIVIGNITPRVIKQLPDAVLGHARRAADSRVSASQRMVREHAVFGQVVAAHVTDRTSEHPTLCVVWEKPSPDLQRTASGCSYQVFDSLADRVRAAAGSLKEMSGSVGHRPRGESLAFTVAGDLFLAHRSATLSARHRE